MAEFIAHSKLLELLKYDPETGEFRWLKPQRGCRMRAGDLAGCKHRTGYWIVRVDGRGYGAHRLAWFYFKGEWPAVDIDHKNGDAADNRLENLRPSTHSQNMANRKRNVSNQVGLKGVSRKGRKFGAELTVNGDRRWLGTFETAGAAHAAYVAAAVHAFGEYARAA